MALEHGPNILSNGLVLYVDAANSISYPGSGSSLFGLVSGIGATISGTAGFSTSNRGSLILNYTADGYIYTSSLTWRSVCMWVNFSSTQGAVYYLFDGRTGVADSWFYSSPSDSIGPAWSKFHLNGVQITIDSTNGLSNTTLFERNKWLHVYLELTTIGTGDIHIFSRYTNNELLTGNVSQVQIYNRVLSQQEISQNFNATRGRYGI
jgi:hypothetical protein